jgi:DMSO/TMAO reductase YedYZ molybdopterin-dependent catalytic subunit
MSRSPPPNPRDFLQAETPYRMMISMDVEKWTYPIFDPGVAPSSLRSAEQLPAALVVARPGWCDGSVGSSSEDARNGGPDDTRPIGRRVVLGVVALGAGGVLGGAAVQRWLAGVAKHDPTGIANLLPLGDQFRFYSVTGGVSRADPAGYRLAVTGLVDKPASYSLADLGALPQTSMVRDFQCVTGWRVPKVPWSGVRLADLLALSGVQPAGQALRFVSFDGTYTESLTLEQAHNPDMLVATRMLNGPVSHDHGGPVRLYAAPMYGYKSIKWLSEIQVVDAVRPGYWEGYGYDVDAWVGRSNGRNDDVPTT